jgi:hypothetical protein
MNSFRLVTAVIGLTSICPLTAAAPVAPQANGLIARQHPIICTTGAGTTSYTQANIAIGVFYQQTWGVGQTSISIPPQGYSLTNTGATIGVGSQAGTTEPLDIGIVQIINHWNAIKDECSADTGGFASGYLVLPEDPNYAAYIN